MLKKMLQITNLLKFICGGLRPLAGPLKVQWDILYRCNSRCVTCDRWQALEGQNNLPLERELKLIEELASVGTLSIAFSGGEPFLRKDIFELIRHTKKNGMSCSINSNGLLITDAIVEKIIESGLSMLYLSLDGGTAETNDYIRGVPGSFNKTLAAIERLRKASGNVPKLFVNCTVNNKNVSELGEMVRSAYKAGVDGVTIQPAHNCEGMEFALPPDLMLSGDSMPIFKQQLTSIMKEYPSIFPMMAEYFLNFDTFIKNPEILYRYRCVAAYTSVQIHPNGDVYSCPVAFHKMGNLIDSPFRDIWFSKEADQLRLKIKNGEHPMCWFTCVAPASILLSNIRSLRFNEIFRPEFIKHILSKL